jgi:DNA-binding transcriptional ArsR family regulator
VTSSGFGLFGTGIRTKTLIAISVLEETHAAELARLLGAGVTTVRNTLDTLEQAGVVAGVLEGKTRRIKLDKRYRAYEELKVLLEKLALGDPTLLAAIADIRRRPRRAGKAL